MQICLHQIRWRTEESGCLVVQVPALNLLRMVNKSTLPVQGRRGRLSEVMEALPFILGLGQQSFLIAELDLTQWAASRDPYSSCIHQAGWMYKACHRMRLCNGTGEDVRVTGI